MFWAGKDKIRSLRLKIRIWQHRGAISFLLTYHIINEVPSVFRPDFRDVIFRGLLYFSLFEQAASIRVARISNSDPAVRLTVLTRIHPNPCQTCYSNKVGNMAGRDRQKVGGAPNVGI
jgi:hypothetical protein